jgi:hypothetical protein
MQDDKHFEFKYQQHIESLNDQQTLTVLITLVKILYVDFFKIYGGKYMTLIELMIMHRKIFSLIDNLHDLCCKGNKDYREALANV